MVSSLTSGLGVDTSIAAGESPSEEGGGDKDDEDDEGDDGDAEPLVRSILTGLDKAVGGTTGEETTGCSEATAVIKGDEGDTV